jgi:hypothetical protein
MRDADDKKDEAPRSPSAYDEPTSVEARNRPLRAGGEPGRADTPLPALEHRYEILGEAGRGGMGVVYRARDRETNESVALKVLKPEIANDPAIIERFKDELKLARKVTHKNVCRIHEFNRAADGSAYISMEFVDGDSLRRILGRFGQFALRKGIQIAEQICAGLGEAHAQGVVHRDLKPENIMLDQAGNVKIMDFGIARSLETGTTRTSGILGTPAYMSPEQAAGKKVDHRADIYSLGLILYEIFTGSAAFSGQTPVEIALKQVHETPPPPRTVEPTLPAYIENAILKCLEKNPDKRFQSAEQLEAALTRQPEEKPVAAEGAGVTMPGRLAFWQRSDWYLLGSAVLGMILFFPLFYRFHPAPALEITVDAEQARQIASEALSKLGWDGEAQTPELQLEPHAYYGVASTLGSSAFLKAARSSYIGIGHWDGRVRFRAGTYASAGYRIDTSGRFLQAYRIFADRSRYQQTGSPPTAAARAQMRELARNTLRKLYGQDAAVGDPVPEPDPYSRSFRWKNTFGPGGFLQTFYWTVVGSDVASLGRWVVPSSVAEHDRSAFQIAPRSFLVAPLLALFALGLFLLRRLHRQPRSVPNLCLAGLVALGFTPALIRFWGSYTGIGGTALNVAVPATIFCIALLLSYGVLNAVLYYLRSRFPGQTASYLLLFREHVFGRGAGLALLRGTFAGLAFSGCWMALLALAGLHGQALPGATGLPSLNIDVFRSDFLAEILAARHFSVMITSGVGIGEHVYVDFGPLIARNFPMVLIGEVLMVGWLLVAFPLSLLGRVSKRWRILLPALAALWMAFGFSLAGATVFPRLPYYIFVALQAAFFGGLFLRYDLLTTLSAAFTIEILLLAFPFLEVLQQIDPLPYLIPIGLWALLLLAAAGLYFRPQLVASYRRIAAVFE